MSGEGGPIRSATVIIDDMSEPGSWAKAMETLPSTTANRLARRMGAEFVDRPRESVPVASLKQRIEVLLAADPVVLGFAGSGTIAAIALEVEAEAQGRVDRIAPHGIDDVVAYLEQRRDNAAAVAAASPELTFGYELAKDRARQLEIQIDELRAGLHLGAVAVRLELTLKQEIA